MGRYLKSNHPLLGLTAKRRGPRRPSSEMPDWRLWFLLPGPLIGSVAPGRHGSVSVMPPGPAVEVIGKARDWVLDQAVAFLKVVAKDHILEPIPARLTRAGEPGPADSAPIRRGDEHAIEIVVASGRPVVVISGHAMRTLVSA